jgi:hypothetical protein
MSDQKAAMAARAIELMKLFISGLDRSIGLANQIEDALQSGFPDDNNDVNDLVVALACYRPEGGPNLYDCNAMVRMLTLYMPAIEKLAAA